MDTATARPSVFVSYNQADRSWAEWIAWTLKKDGYPVVIQAWDFRPGSNFPLEMHKAAAETDKTLIVLSDNYLRSGFTQPEWAAAFARDPQGRKRKLIPVRVAACSPDGLLAQIVWEDLVGLSEAAARDRLLQAFENSGEPLHAPAFPGSAPPDRVTAVPFPGDPPLHNLPYPRLGDLFTGRQDELEALAGGGTAAITQSAAISGLGGIGKTRLAVEYAWRSGNRYTASWFVRADSPENLRRNLAALAGPELLNLQEWEAQVEDKTVAAVKRWLREHPGWLMILDNVDTPEAADAVLEVLPSLSIGRVLITSRLTSWPASVRKQLLDMLSAEDAVSFLLQRTEEGRAKADDDNQQAAALAAVLDGLPLALEQAAAFILRRRLQLAEYLRAWERERSEVLKWHDPRVMEYPVSVAVTWQQTFLRLSPTAAALLRLMAFLAPDPIPVDMFEQGADEVWQVAQRLCEEVGREPDEFSIQDAFDELAEYSMVSRQDGGTVTVHRMVQEVLKSQIPEERRTDWTKGVLRITEGAFPYDSDDFRTWPACDRLRPHAIRLVSLADQAGMSDPISLLSLMKRLAEQFSARAVYTEAEPLMRRALAIADAIFGNDHPWSIGCLHNLADLLRATNRLVEAEPLMRRALAIAEAAFGSQHPIVATILNALALLLQEKNQLDEAESLFRRALAIDEASLGTEHPNVGRDLNNLARLLLNTGRREEAEPLSRRALFILEKSFDPQHPSVALALGTLSALLETTNRPEEAELLMRRALAIDEASLGNEHPNVAIRLNNLAALLKATNRPEEAEQSIRRALAIHEASFGPEHPEVATDLRDLALLLEASDRLEEAEPLIRRALAIHEDSFGPEHREVATDLNNLVWLLNKTNRLGEAEPLRHRAQDILEKSLALRAESLFAEFFKALRDGGKK